MSVENSQNDHTEGRPDARADKLHIASIRFEGNKVLPTLEELPEYSESMLPPGIKNKDELLAAAVLAVAGYSKSVLDFMEKEGPQTKEALIAAAPERFDLPDNVKQQILDQLISDGRVLTTENGEYSTPMHGISFYPIERNVREKLEAALPPEMARTIRGRVGVAGGRIIKEGEVPGDPEGLYNMIPAGAFREMFGSSGIIEQFSTARSALSRRYSNDDVELAMACIADFVVNSVADEIVGRAQAALKAREANPPLKGQEISASWNRNGEILINPLLENLDAGEKLERGMHDAFEEDAEISKLLGELGAVSARRLALVPEGNIEARKLNPNVLREDAEYIAKLNAFVEKVSASRLAVKPVLSGKEQSKVGERLLADIKEVIASNISAGGTSAESATARLSQSIEVYGRIIALSSSIMKTKEAASVSLEDLKELESTAKRVRERINSEVSSAMDISIGAMLDEVERHLSAYNEKMEAYKKLSASILAARSKIVSQFRNYTPLVGFGYHLLQVLHNKIETDADKLGTLNVINAETKFIDTAYSENVMQKIQETFITLAESDLFSKHRREGHNDVVEIMIRLFNSIAIAADSGEVEKIASLLNAFAPSNVKDSKVHIIVEAHKGAIAAVEMKLKGTATYDVVKLITNRLSEEAKAALMKIASFEDIDADKEFCKSAEPLKELSDVMERVEKSVASLNSEKTAVLASIIDGRVRMQKIVIMQGLVIGAPLADLNPAKLSGWDAVAGTIAGRKALLEKLLCSSAGIQLGEHLLKRIESLISAADSREELQRADSKIKKEISRIETFVTEMTTAGKEEVKRDELPAFVLLSPQLAKAMKQNPVLPLPLYRYATAVALNSEGRAEDFAETARAARSILLDLKETPRAQRYALLFMDMFAKRYDASPQLRGTGPDRTIISKASAKIEETAKKGILRGGQPKLLKLFDSVIHGLEHEPKKAAAVAEMVFRRLEKDKDQESLISALEPISGLYFSQSASKAKNGKEKSTVK